MGGPLCHACGEEITRNDPGYGGKGGDWHKRCRPLEAPRRSKEKGAPKPATDLLERVLLKHGIPCTDSDRGLSQDDMKSIVEAIGLPPTQPVEFIGLEPLPVRVAELEQQLAERTG